MWRREKHNVSDVIIEKFLIRLKKTYKFIKTMRYISEIEKIYKNENIRKTKIQRPEVSIAMKELTKRGWIKKGKNKTKDNRKQYNVFIYDMIRYPPNCNPPDKKNT